MKNEILVLILTIFTWGCTVGPNYRRPKIDVPTTYRGPSTTPAQGPSRQGSQPAASSPQQQSFEQSFGDQKWWEVFQDLQLQELIHTALSQNTMFGLQQRESSKHKRS